jgi:predicted ArsR family transcriptional regulator
VAKFHLDRLVADGLLDFDYRRPAGRGGPGAGRPAKVYRATGDIDVSIPPRRYDLAGRLLVRAIATSARDDLPVTAAVSDVARAAGHDLARQATGPRRRRLRTALEACGFDPVESGGEVTLHNCPFHRLAEEDRDLVCHMNLAFVRGLLDGLGAAPASAELDPLVGGCCVRIRTR